MLAIGKRDVAIAALALASLMAIILVCMVAGDVQ